MLFTRCIVAHAVEPLTYDSGSQVRRTSNCSGSTVLNSTVAAGERR